MTAIACAFDYSGFEPMDGGHGSRWVNRKKRDRLGLRLQVAGPWKAEGCVESATCSFSWMRELVWRRDGLKCVACGSAAGDGEVQHIVPRRWIADLFFPHEETTYENVVTGRRQTFEWYVNLGTCGHNLALLCRPCHVLTFSGNHSTGDYGGIPSVGPRRAYEKPALEEFARRRGRGS